MSGIQRHNSQTLPPLDSGSCQSYGHIRLANLGNHTAPVRDGRAGAACQGRWPLSGSVRSRELGMPARLARRARAQPICVELRGACLPVYACVRSGQRTAWMGTAWRFYPVVARLDPCHRGAWPPREGPPPVPRLAPLEILFGVACTARLHSTVWPSALGFDLVFLFLLSEFVSCLTNIFSHGLPRPDICRRRPWPAAPVGHFTGLYIRVNNNPPTPFIS